MHHPSFTDYGDDYNSTKIKGARHIEQNANAIKQFQELLLRHQQQSNAPHQQASSQQRQQSESEPEAATSHSGPAGSSEDDHTATANASATEMVISTEASHTQAALGAPIVSA